MLLVFWDTQMGLTQYYLRPVDDVQSSSRDLGHGRALRDVSGELLLAGSL